MEDSANAIGSASFEASAQVGVQVAIDELGKTDAGKVAGEWAGAVATGIGVGAAAGAVCGPFAPVCSAVGAIAGALIALGIKIASLFDSTIDTHPCKVFDGGDFVTRRCPNLTESSDGNWQVGPYGMEVRFWETRQADWPKGLTLGFILWTMRRIKEDGLGYEYLGKLLKVMGQKVQPRVVLTGKALDAAADRIRTKGTLAAVLGDKATPAMYRGMAAAQAGGNVFEINRAMGRPTRDGERIRYERTKKLLDAEFATRFGVTKMALGELTELKNESFGGKTIALALGALYVAYRFLK